MYKDDSENTAVMQPQPFGLVDAEDEARIDFESAYETLFHAYLRIKAQEKVKRGRDEQKI
jgi:hypothetical protein